MSIIRPKINLLNDDYKSKILEEAERILETQGVFIENQDASELLQNEGLKPKRSQFFIPKDIIKRCLQSAPEEIKLYDREGENYLSLRENDVHFDPGSAAILILDENTGKIRDAQSKDFIRFSKIVEHLKYIDAQSTALIYQDYPKDAQDWHRLYLALTYCHKPVITGTFRKESFSIM